jgi:DNA polymerase zeta
MCDYNLYGCALIACARVRFRSPVPEFNSKSEHHQWHDKSISSEWISDPLEFPRESHCDIELDLCVQDILNRHEVASRDIHHDFSERFLSTAQDEKYVPSMAGLWKDEGIRRKKKLGITNPGSSPFPPEALVTMSADPRLAKGNWIHEEEYSKLVMDMIEAEKSQVPKEKMDFERFNGPFLGAHLKSTQEGVEDLYPENLLIGSHSHEPADLDDSTALVDETSIFEDLQEQYPHSHDEHGHESESHQDYELSESHQEYELSEPHQERTNESDSISNGLSHSIPTDQEQRSQQKQVTFHGTGSDDTGSFPTKLAGIQRVPAIVSAEPKSSPNLVKVTALLSSVFALPDSSRTQIFGKLPPLVPGRLSTIYQDAHYSDESDIPDKAHGYAGKEVKLESNTLPYLPYFDRQGLSPASLGEKPAIVLDKDKEEETYRGIREACTLRNWQISTAPPSA